MKLDETTTYTMLPAAMLDKIEPVLKNRGIEYECLYGPDIPDDVSEICVFQGRQQLDHLVCVASHLDPEKLLHYTEWLHHSSGEEPDLM